MQFVVKIMTKICNMIWSYYGTCFFLGGRRNDRKMILYNYFYGILERKAIKNRCVFACILVLYVLSHL